MSGRVHAVVGGAFGSEAKGAVCGYIAQREAARHARLLFVRAGGPNAGHTVWDDEGREWKLRSVPIGAPLIPDSIVAIGPGSEIDPPVLYEEVESLRAAGHKFEILVDPQCTVITDDHKQQEADRSLQAKIGSTQKGIGAARADRIWRTAPIWGVYTTEAADELERCQTLDIRTVDVADYLAQWLEGDGDVLCEAAQGYGLGLHQGWYPTCTSADATVQHLLADCGIQAHAPWVAKVEPWVVLRTYPIRVAGNSGPLVDELTWEELAVRTDGYIKPEQTTVTKKTRRVGEWDPALAARAVRANGGSAVNVALTFLDYINPAVAGMTDWDQIVKAWPEVEAYVDAREREIAADIKLVGTGPASCAWIG